MNPRLAFFILGSFYVFVLLGFLYPFFACMQESAGKKLGNPIKSRRRKINYTALHFGESLGHLHSFS
jgi:hypothetical protein